MNSTTLEPDSKLQLIHSSALPSAKGYILKLNIWNPNSIKLQSYRKKAGTIFELIKIDS